MRGAFRDDVIVEMIDVCRMPTVQVSPSISHN